MDDDDSAVDRAGFARDAGLLPGEGVTEVDEVDERGGLQDEKEWKLQELLDTGVAEFKYLYDLGASASCRI